MEPKPVLHSRPPAYPTRREVLAGAASFALIHLTGCSFVSEEAQAGEIIVAPIFEHGEGRGAVGCVVVSPPVFLSEEEAVQIVREELAKHGVELKAGGTLKGVRIPSRMEMLDLVDKGGGETEVKESVVEMPDEAKPLRLDGLDPDRKIAVKFVSCKGYHDLGGPLSASTVQGYDFKDVARQVATAARQQAQDSVFFGVFYDPSTKFPLSEPADADDKVDWETAWKKREEHGKKESEKLLRQQVQDFVGWLKEQKAIQ